MLLLGDCNDWLKEIKDNSIDLICTDPPYALTPKSYGEGKHKGGFMGKEWDSALVSVETWQQCYRVLKDGKLAFIMSSPRQDVLSRMIINLEDAGFKTNYTSIYHTFASGFPKAKNNHDGSYVNFSPKPAVEVIIVVSKGRTRTWLDDVRIPYQSEQDKETAHYNSLGPTERYKTHKMIYDGGKKSAGFENTFTEKGRFPANLLVSDDCLNDGKITKSTGGVNAGTIGKRVYGNYKGGVIGEGAGGYGDTGSYSRYFSLDSWAKTFPFLIVPKASRSERGEFNSHATVKPIKLMSYLITMGSREGDLVLDPFCGSGTVCIAAHQLHRKWLGIEMNPEYAEIIKKRLADPLAQLKLTAFA